MQDIVDTAVAAGTFTKLVSAVQKAGLVDTLKGTGPFTVFAPNDEAFAKIPESTLNDLLNDTDKLSKLLTYHVVSGKVMSSDALELSRAKTVEGEDLIIDHFDGKLNINDAQVVQADIQCSNGVIHVIDMVIIPPSIYES